MRSSLCVPEGVQNKLVMNSAPEQFKTTRIISSNDTFFYFSLILFMFAVRAQRIVFESAKFSLAMTLIVLEFYSIFNLVFEMFF